MYKKEIKFIYDFNVNKLQTLNNRLTISDIKKCKLHPALFEYIEAAINQEIFLDKKQILDNSRFNYSSDRINDYFNLISGEIKRTQHLDLDYVKELLQKAIHFNASYLAQPNNTLISLVYGDKENKTVEEIITSLSHVYYYRYLKKILFTFLDKKKIISLRKSEFTSLLKRIDKISKETHLENTLSTTVNSMTHFFDPNNKDNSRLPIDAIKLYLEEKGLNEYLIKLTNSFNSDLTTLIFAAEILNILKSVTPEREIVITESIYVEEELVADEIEEVPILKENESDVVEIEVITEEVNEIVITDIVENNDEIDIPNEELLSCENPTVGNVVTNENFTEDNDEFIAENSEQKTENRPFQSTKEIEKVSEDSKNPDQKKKPDTKVLVRELINLDSIYKTLIPPPTPFEHERTNLSETKDFLSNYNDELEYQFDKSTIKEELDIIETDLVHVSNEVENINKNEIENSTEINGFETSSILSEKKDDYNNGMDISNTINEVVNNDPFEEDFLSREEEDLGKDDLIEQHKPNSLLDESKLTLLEEDEEEITEVFTDLTYLEESLESERTNDLVSNEEQQDINEIEAIGKKEENHDLENNTPVDNEESFLSFSELTYTKDMTRVIESIFDYDMEDYHSILQKISDTKSESDAFQIIDNYCSNNSINKASKDSQYFRSLISEYFKKVYT